MLKLLICCFSENKGQLTCNQLKTKEIIFQDCKNIFLALFFFSRLRKIKVNVQSPDQIFFKFDESGPLNENMSRMLHSYRNKSTDYLYCKLIGWFLYE